MKVVYLIRALYNSGGKERIITEKANYLSKRYGYEVFIITTDQKNRPNFYELNKDIKTINLDVNYEDLNKCSLIKKIFLYIKKNKEYKKKLDLLLRGLKPEKVISTYEAEVSFLYKFPYSTIVELHFCRNFRYFQKFYYTKNFFEIQIAKIRNYLDKKLLLKYKNIVLLTIEDQKLWNIKNTVVIPNIIHFKDDYENITKKNIVISVGRLDPQKGFDLLINAWNTIKNQTEEWELHIYGNGPAKDELEKRIKELKIEHRIKLMGETNNIREKYLESSIYVLSSRFEGLPMVILEAMGLGLPVIAFKCPCGPMDVIEHEVDGILVENGNEKELGKEILKLIKDKKMSEKLGNEAKKKSQLYLADKIMPLWKNIIEENKN